MEYEKIVVPTVTEIFESRIQASILSGELKIGDRLPAERELAELMGISKSTVHMGIKNLERMGFVEILPRQGMYVANWPENGGMDTIAALMKSNVLKLEYKDILSLVRIREVLEADAIKEFAVNHRPEDIASLRRIAARIRMGGQPEGDLSLRELAELAFRFTHYICFHSGNTFSSLIFNAFRSFALELWEEWLRQIGTNEAARLLEAVTDCIALNRGQEAISIIHNYNRDFLERISKK